MTTVDPAALPPTDAEITFDGGIPGFPGSTRYVIARLGDADESAFQLLQSIDEPDVALIVTEPWLFFPDYAPVIPDADQEDLELTSPDDAIVFCSVTLDSQAGAVYLNLLGPFVVNGTTRRGRQVVLAESGYPTRARVELAGD